MIEDLYQAVQEITDGLRSVQEWHPCFECPVSQTSENCCHYAMFHVTKTEWDFLKEHPYIKKHRTNLILASRSKLRKIGFNGDSAGLITEYSTGRRFTCPLFDAGSGKCSVYDRRPLICRTYGVGFPTTSGEVFGCRVVTGEVSKHNGEKVSFVPLDQINAAASTIFEAPSKPIVVWLAEEKL